MKVYFKTGAIALLSLSLAVGVSSCRDDDPVPAVPPEVKEVHMISGSVAAMDGSGISGATVTMSGAATGTATTDANGYFLFVNVEPGTYNLSVTASGKLPKETSVTIVDSDKGQNAVWNVMLASEESVTKVNISAEDGGEGDVVSEALRNNDLAEIPIEIEAEAGAIDRDAVVTIAPIYSEAEALTGRADTHTMLIGANVECSDKSAKIVKPFALTFEVDPETITNIKAQKLVNGTWVDVEHEVQGDKIIISADEFTSYALFGNIVFASTSRNEVLAFIPNEWDNLYGSSTIHAAESKYTYKVGMDIQSRGTTVFTALLIEALARHFGANSYTTTATYPLDVDVPVGTYVGISGVQKYNTVSASLGGRSVNGLQYGDVTVVVVSSNRDHNGSSSTPSN